MAGSVVAYDLTADHALNPLSLGGAPSRLTWRVRGDGGVPAQVEVEAASTLNALEAAAPDVWSGSLKTGDPWIDWPSAIPLGSRSTIWWRVRLSTEDGSVGPWSGPARFELALLKAEDWSGQWISHPAWVGFGETPPALPVLTTVFDLKELPVSARLYGAGLGVSETFVNGGRVDGAFLESGYADYDVRIPASTYDVEDLLRIGPNRLHVALGTGASYVSRLADRYTKLEREQISPRYLGQLELRFADGSRLTIGTDETWGAHLGEVAVAHWYGGEDVDEVRADRDPQETFAVTVGAVSSLPPLWWKTTAPIRVVEKVAPTSVEHFADGHRLIDFGVNVAGRIRADLTGLTPGATVEFRPSELLHVDRTVDQTSTGSPIYDRYTPRGTSGVFAPSLTYHGFRYSEIHGLTEATPDMGFAADVLRADLPRVGTVITSSAFINTLHSIIDRAVQGNMYSVFTDCPHREKLGWIEQLYLCFDVLARNYEVGAQLRQMLIHIRDVQLPSGMIPSTAPEFINFSGDVWRGDPNGFRDDPNWGGVIAFLPWALYRTYADRSVLEENWDAIVRYIDYLATREDHGILDHGLGDWVAIDTSTPRAMVATFGYQRIVATAARIARALDLDYESRSYEVEADRIRRAFTATFGSDDGLSWASGSQASLALALDLGAVPGTAYDAVFQSLVSAVEATGYQVSVGENALPSLLRVLDVGGRNDLIDALIRQPDGPGYAHQIASGATALTESWQGPEGPSGQGSQNHFMLGMIDGWLSGSVGGLRQAATSIGWREVVVEPVLLDSLDWAETTFDSPAGWMSTRWERLADGIDITVTLPPGTRGVLVIGDIREELQSGTHHKVVSATTLGLPENVA